MADARQVNSNARRLRGSITRVEQTPYDATSSRRLPRVMPNTFVWGYCQLSSSLGPATGTWPSLTPTTQGGILVYRNINAVMTLVDGAGHVKNWRNVTWAVNKTTLVYQQVDGSWEVMDQDC